MRKTGFRNFICHFFRRIRSIDSDRTYVNDLKWSSPWNCKVSLIKAPEKNKIKLWRAFYRDFFVFTPQQIRTMESWLCVQFTHFTTKSLLLSHPIRRKKKFWSWSILDHKRSLRNFCYRLTKIYFQLTIFCTFLLVNQAEKLHFLKKKKSRRLNF